MEEFIKVVNGVIEFNADLFKRYFKPRSTTLPSTIAKTEYIKVVDGVIEFDKKAFRRDFERR